MGKGPADFSRTARREPVLSASVSNARIETNQSIDCSDWSLRQIGMKLDLRRSLEFEIVIVKCSLYFLVKVIIKCTAERADMRFLDLARIGNFRP